jgi:hypothetical protein
MNIDQLKGNSYNPKRTGKNDSSAKTEKANSRSGNAQSKSGGLPKNAANLSLSGSEFKNEVAFTKKVLANSRKESLASLPKIKQNISAGVYNSEKITKEISANIADELSSLPTIPSEATDKASSETEITEDHKKRLLDDPQVTKAVADKIANVLKNI